MFLLGLTISFLAAQMMVKNWKKFGEEEDALEEFDVFQDNDEIVTIDGKHEDQDIFLISDINSAMDVNTRFSIQATTEATVPISCTEILGLKDSISDKIRKQLSFLKQIKMKK